MMGGSKKKTKKNITLLPLIQECQRSLYLRRRENKMPHNVPFLKKDEERQLLADNSTPCGDKKS